MSQIEDCTFTRSVKDRRSTFGPKIRSARRYLEEVIIERRSFRLRRRVCDAVAPSLLLARDGLGGRVVAASFARRGADSVDLGEYFGVRTPARPSETFDVVLACARIPDRVVVDHAREFATQRFLRSAEALGIAVQHRPGFLRRGG